MNFELFDNLRDMQCTFIEGRSIFYACFFPKYDQFKNELSIFKIFEPIKTKIVSQKIFYANINDADKHGLRNQQLHLYFENSEKIVISLFVRVDQTVCVSHEEPHIMIGFDENEIKMRFYREIVNWYNNALQNETTIIEDDKFRAFIRMYEVFIAEFPEEVLNIIGTSVDDRKFVNLLKRS